MDFQYNFQKLKGRMVEYYGTQGNFAKAMGTSKQNLSRKLNNKIKFTYDEITFMIKNLHITSEEVQEIFFNTNC